MTSRSIAAFSMRDRIGRGAFADVFSPAPHDRAYKLFRHNKGDPITDGLASFVFAAEVAAYEIATRDTHLQSHVPEFYGAINISRVEDARGSDISSNYSLCHCYAMRRLPADPLERKFGSFFGTEYWSDLARLDELCEEKGIRHLGDSSVLHWKTRRYFLIDFATYDAAAEHSSMEPSE
jgi:hypothetical protein